MAEQVTNPILWPKPQKATKQKKLLLIIASCMRLLLVVREALRAANAENSPLFKAVNEHAQMCGQALPNSMRLPIEELNKIKTNSALTADEAEPSRIVKP